MHKYVRDWNEVGVDIILAFPILIIVAFLSEHC